MYFKFAMMLKSPWHFHVQLSVISHTSQTGLRSSCCMWLKCHSLPGNASACATENSSGAGRGLSRFLLSETSASRESLNTFSLKYTVCTVCYILLAKTTIIIRFIRKNNIPT